MGRRSRRNAPSEAAPEKNGGGRRSRGSVRDRAGRASRAAEIRIKQRPPAPWDPFPLTELTIFAGLVLVVVGMLIASPTGRGMAIAGVVLACIGGLETTVREHLAGYRSHAGLLAGGLALLALIAATALFKVGGPVRGAVAIGVFAVTFPLLRSSFLRKSGGSGVL